MRTWVCLLLVAACASVEDGEEPDDAGEARAAAATLSALDSFETDAAAAAWREAAWAGASQDGAGHTLRPHRTAAGVTGGASALAVPVRFTGKRADDGAAVDGSRSDRQVVLNVVGSTRNLRIML